MKNKILTLLVSIFFILNLPILCTANIQSLVDNTTAGNTTYISSGTYPEEIVINTPDITLIGNGATVNGIAIHAPNVTIDGFKVVSTGIELYDGMSACTIKNNDVSNVGINLDLNSGNNVIKNNKIHDCTYGLSIAESRVNTIEGNSITDCTVGITMYEGFDNTFIGNTINKNGQGIALIENSGNTFTKNQIKYNSEYGIYFKDTDVNTNMGNEFYNNAFNNTNNVYMNEYSFPNTWNTAKTTSKNVIGGKYTYGNYWGTPRGNGFSNVVNDTNRDGIGDIPYKIGKDNVDAGVLCVIGGTTPTNTSPEYTYTFVNSTTHEVIQPVESTTPVESSSGSKSHGSKHSYGKSKSGTGFSPEPAGNIAIKEIVKVPVVKGHNVVKFPLNVTNVSYLEFDSERNFGTQQIVVEELKNKSNLTKVDVNESVVKYVNIWTSSSLNNKTVHNCSFVFKLNNTVSDVNVSKYTNNSWKEQNVSMLTNDTYYKVDTNAYGQYVVYNTAGVPSNTTTNNSTNMTIKEPFKKHHSKIWIFICNILGWEL